MRPLCQSLKIDSTHSRSTSIAAATCSAHMHCAKRRCVYTVKDAYSLALPMYTVEDAYPHALSLNNVKDAYK
eukprot:1138198-Pelagomonas_calceolata.AAC.13